MPVIGGRWRADGLEALRVAEAGLRRSTMREVVGEDQLLLRDELVRPGTRVTVERDVSGPCPSPGRRSPREPPVRRRGHSPFASGSATGAEWGDMSVQDGRGERRWWVDHGKRGVVETSCRGELRRTSGRDRCHRSPSAVPRAVGTSWASNSMKAGTLGFDDSLRRSSSRQPDHPICLFTVNGRTRPPPRMMR